MKKKTWKQKKGDKRRRTPLEIFPSGGPCASPEFLTGRAASEEELDESFRLIADLAEAFCEAHRNDDDSELCRDVIETLLDIGFPLDLEALMADTDMMPPEAQEETHRRGLIPYIPADRDKPPSKSDGGAGVKILPFPSGRNKVPGSKSRDVSKEDAPGLSNELE